MVDGHEGGPISLQREEFEQAVRAYSADLYRFAYWLCRDRHVAEDLVQEACLHGWKSWGDLRELAQAKGWLMTIVRNEYARNLSRKRSHTSLEDVDEGELPSIPSFEGVLALVDVMLGTSEG